MRGIKIHMVDQLINHGWLTIVDTVWGADAGFLGADLIKAYDKVVFAFLRLAALGTICQCCNST